LIKAFNYNRKKCTPECNSVEKKKKKKKKKNVYVNENERMSRCILNEVETISIQMYFILTISITEDGSQSSFLIIASQLVFFS